MDKILEKLTALLPTIESGATAIQVGANELSELMGEIKAKALETRQWTDEHEAALVLAGKVIAPSAPAPQPAPENDTAAPKEQTSSDAAQPPAPEAAPKPDGTDKGATD